MTKMKAIFNASRAHPLPWRRSPCWYWERGRVEKPCKSSDHWTVWGRSVCWVKRETMEASGSLLTDVSAALLVRKCVFGIAYEVIPQKCIWNQGESNQTQQQQLLCALALLHYFFSQKSREITGVSQLPCLPLSQAASRSDQQNQNIKSLLNLLIPLCGTYVT